MDRLDKGLQHFSRLVVVYLTGARRMAATQEA